LSAVEWIAWTVSLLIIASLALLLPAYWRGELVAQHEASTKGWWPLGERLRGSFFRGLHLVAIAGLAIIIWRLLIALRGSRNELIQTIVQFGEPVCAIVFFVALILELSVWLFGRPRFLVPPPYR
jgi:hypothetical protein